MLFHILLFLCVFFLCVLFLCMLFLCVIFLCVIFLCVIFLCMLFLCVLLLCVSNRAWNQSLPFIPTSASRLAKRCPLRRFRLYGSLRRYCSAVPWDIRV